VFATPQIVDLTLRVRKLQIVDLTLRVRKLPHAEREVYDLLPLALASGSSSRSSRMVCRAFSRLL